jgi:osmoprotectant transport system substrate-binding protein
MQRWLFVAVVLVLGACSGSDAGDGLSETEEIQTAERRESIVVASFDFAESRLVAEIYAQALEDEGITVDRQLGLGPRELVVPALRQGLVDVVPEYAGSALDAAAPTSKVDRRDVEAVVDELAAAVDEWGLDVLAPSPASNQNVVVVTEEMASERGVEATSDLGPTAASLTLGGPPECPVRPSCLLGLVEVYGLGFDSFVPLAGEELVQRALVDGVIDVGVLFSTDAVLAGDALVVLRDDRELQPADNIVPLVRAGVLDDWAIAALDEVSELLTTSNLRFLNWRVANAGHGEVAEARAWLLRQDLVAR